MSLALALLVLAAGPAAACTTTASTEIGIQNAVVAARSGDVVCVTAGSYSNVLIGGPHAGMVYLEPAPAAAVSMANLNFSSTSTHITVSGITVTDELEFENDGGEFLRVEHMDLNRILMRAGVTDTVITRNTLHAVDGNAIALAGNTRTPVERIEVSQNLIETPLTDGIFAAAYRDLDVVRNEIYGLVEIGNHSDVFQSTSGGSDLTISQNYAHDFDGQGFFIKDGVVRGVTIDNNLVVRDSGGSPLQLYDTDGGTITRNTIWDNANGVLLRQLANQDLDVQGNVFEYFTPVDDDGVADGDASNTWYDPVTRTQIATRITEDCNVLGGGWTWSESGRNGPNDDVYVPDTGNGRPDPGERAYWAATAFPHPNLRDGDDWQVTDEPCGDPIGVDWVPGDWPVGQ